jgi:nucleotide-binding universal stress UspA family protein
MSTKESGMYKRILVPVDGSATSLAGLRQALVLAKQNKARLRLVHIVDMRFVAQAPGGILISEPVFDLMRNAGRKVLARAQALAAGAGVKSETAMKETFGERVAVGIVAEARKWRADLVVIGTHGRRGFSRAVLGSDAEEVVRSTRVPVLLVRAKGSPR